MVTKLICGRRTPPDPKEMKKKRIHPKTRIWKDHKKFELHDMTLYDFHNNPYIHHRIKQKLIQLYRPQPGDYSVQIVSPYRMTKALNLTISEEEMRIGRPLNF